MITSPHWCEPITKTTTEALSILTELRTTIYHNTPQHDSLVTLCLYVVHDWLAQVTHGTEILPDYETSFRQEIVSHPQLDEWSRSLIMNIRHTRYSSYALAYRHRLVSHILEKELIPQDIPSVIFQMIGNMPDKVVQFASLADDGIWSSISNNPIRINILRQNTLKLQHIRKELANRLDETEDRLVVDHAMLSSFSLLYSLYLLEAFLDYALAIQYDTRMMSIRSILIHTLDQLRGVFFHVKD